MDRLRTEQHPGVWHSGELNPTAFEADVSVGTVTEGARRVNVAWRKEEVDVARLRQGERAATSLGKLSSRMEA